MSAFDELADSLTQVIAGQARTYLAKVVGVGNIKTQGRITAYSELLGAITVEARTSDRLADGDMIFVRRAGPEKYGKFLYAGYSGGSSGEMPGISADARIYVPPPVDTEGSTAPSGTLQYVLDQIVLQIRQILGEGVWTATPANNLHELVNWRGTVAEVGDLPASDNRLGDIRAVLTDLTLYIWSGGEWQSLSGSGAGSSGMTTILPVGSLTIPAYSIVTWLDSGVVLASAMELTHKNRIVGITLEEGIAHTSVLVQTGGSITFPSSVFAQLGPVYVGTDGEPATSPLPDAAFVQQLGNAVSSMKLIIALEMSLTASGDRAFLHLQDTPSALWTIVHNLEKYPSVGVVDGDGEVIYGDVRHYSTNEVRVQFSVPVAGMATCN